MCKACIKTTNASLSSSSLHSLSSTDLDLEGSCSTATEKQQPCKNSIPSKQKKQSRLKRVRFAPSQPQSETHSRSSQSSSSTLPQEQEKRYSVQTDVIDTVKPASSMSDSERSQAYWQLRDYEYFRGTAQIIAAEVLKVTASQPPSSHSYNAVLTRAYDICSILSESSFSSPSAAPASSCDNDKREEKDDSATPSASSSASAVAAADLDRKNKMNLPPHLFAALTHWVKAGHSRRGLEKFCVTSHIRARPMAKAATVQAVLLAQDLLHKQQTEKMSESISASAKATGVKSARLNQNPKKFHIGTSEFPLENLPQDEILRLVSERFSKTSQYYGTAMGHADAAAVGNYEHPMSMKK